MKWFRLYSAVLNDPKVQRLEPVMFKHWVNLLCLANEREPRGTLPSVSDIGFALRIPEEEAQAAVDYLTDAGLLEGAGGSPVPKGWYRHQSGFRPPIPPALRFFLLDRDNYTCQYCGATDVPMEIDHIQPYSRGGSNDPSNLTTACRDCNQAKRARTPEEWLG